MREKRLGARRSKKFMEEHFPETKKMERLKARYSKAHRVFKDSLSLEINIKQAKTMLILNCIIPGLGTIIAAH